MQPHWAGLRRNTIIDQQLWYLGRDIGGPCGNALLAYGFERHRPAGGFGSSAYLLPLRSPSVDEPSVLICWGFGAYVGLRKGCTPLDQRQADAARQSPAPWSGVFFQRFGASPGLVRHAVSPTLHQVADLPLRWTPRSDADRECASRTLSTLAHTLAEYERWAIDTLGSAHRTTALRAAPRHKRHRFLNAPELSEAWERWAELRCSSFEPDEAAPLKHAAA